MATEPDDAMYANFALELQAGRLTPFLGAGVNLIGIDASLEFVPGARLPSGSELARFLAVKRGYPTDPPPELIKVAQWLYSRMGSTALYDELHRIFDHNFPPTPVHEVLAAMPAYIRENDGLEYPLIITTNYDDALERAFTARNEPFDVLTYMATPSAKTLGKFLHTAADGEVVLVRLGKRYQGANLKERPAILKLHGAVRRTAGAASPLSQDSYVVTEDDYIESMAGDVMEKIPYSVAARMKACHYLFLGYSLRDWNLRAMLHRIWKEHVRENKSWAVVTQPDENEVKAWSARDVDIFDLDLAMFASRLAQELTTTTSGAVS
jgi:hypothetical protein